MTWLRDVVYKLDRTRPRTDPCSTPNRRCCGQDGVPDMLMLWYLCEKHDLNRARNAIVIVIIINDKIQLNASNLICEVC